MRDYRVELLKAMLETYSPSGSEGRLAQLLAQEMGSLGFSVVRDPAGNVIGEMGEQGPRILLCGHMDTVPGAIPVRIEENFLYGRGAVDAKSALAAMLFGSHLATKRTSAPFHVTLAGVVEEEASSRGIKSLINQGSPFDLAVFGEPTGTTQLVIGYKGSLRIQVTCLTSGGHSAAPWLSKNSIEEVSEFWMALKQSILQNDSTKKFNALTGCVTGVRAGESDNSIPPRATMNIDIRTPPEIKPEEAMNKIVNFMAEYERAQVGVHFEAEVKDQCFSFMGASNSLAVQAFRWAIKNRFGVRVGLVKKTGTSDMNLFARAHNIPMIAYGPGDSTLDHTENERIRLPEYLDCVEVFAKAIERVAVIYRNHQVRPIPLAR